MSNPLTWWMKSVYFIPLKKVSEANGSHWSHSCFDPKAAANTPLDLRELEHGLPHMRDTRFFQVLGDLHYRKDLRARCLATRLGALSQDLAEESLQRREKNEERRFKDLCSAACC